MQQNATNNRCFDAAITQLHRSDHLTVPRKLSETSPSSLQATLVAPSLLASALAPHASRSPGLAAIPPQMPSRRPPRPCLFGREEPPKPSPTRHASRTLGRRAPPFAPRNYAGPEQGGSSAAPGVACGCLSVSGVGSQAFHFVMFFSQKQGRQTGHAKKAQRSMILV